MSSINLSEYIYRKMFESFKQDFFVLIEQEQRTVGADLESIQQLEVLRSQLFERVLAFFDSDEHVMKHPDSAFRAEVITETFEHCYDELFRFSEAFGHDLDRAKNQLDDFLNARRN